MNDDTLYLIHIMECIRRIETYTSDGRGTFMRSIRDQDAVLRNFEVMGEAAKQVLPATRTDWPDVPWRRIEGLWDVLIHNYQGVDIDRVERDREGPPKLEPPAGLDLARPWC